MIDTSAGARDAYEQLRHHVLAAVPGGGRFGLAVLLREGVAAWLERFAADAAFPSFTAPCEPLLRRTSPVQAGIVQILASIALSRTQEIHS